MAKTRTTPYDAAQYLRTAEDMAAYLEASVEKDNGDVKIVSMALRNIARAKAAINEENAEERGASKR